jgi:hypothetical protein
LELGLRGRLTSFRPDFEPHLSPALPHVTARIVAEEGLTPSEQSFAGADVISLTKGRIWPASVRRRYPALTSVSVILSAERDGVSVERDGASVERDGVSVERDGVSVERGGVSADRGDRGDAAGEG